MKDHPDWCDRLSCNASGPLGAHRGKPVTVDQVQLNLYCDATTPDTPCVEIYCEATLLQPHTAYAVGRVLAQLGRTAHNNGRGNST
jgi:hypothetical protein